MSAAETVQATSGGASGGFALSDEEHRFFHDNGFCGPFTLFSPEEMAERYKRVWPDLVAKRERSVFGDNRSGYDRHLDIPELASWMTRPEVVHRVQSLLGPDLLAWRSEWFPKNPGDEGTDWHQVESFTEFEGTAKLIPTHRDSEPVELTAWLAITDSTRENGCLQFIPGTHRQWFFDERISVDYRPDEVNTKIKSGKKRGFYGYDNEKQKIDPSWNPRDEDAFDAVMRSGQFVLFTSRVIHGSLPNVTKNQRRMGHSMRYVPTHVQVYPGMESFRAFGEVLPLDRWGCLLISGRDEYGHNRIVSAPAAPDPAE